MRCCNAIKSEAHGHGNTVPLQKGIHIIALQTQIVEHGGGSAVDVSFIYKII
jgi:hypothetical protein